MLTWIKDHLREEAAQLGVEAGELTFLKRIGGDLSPGGKALFEILSPSTPHPLWVLKAARTRHGNIRLRLEHERLGHLSKILDHPTSQGTGPTRPISIPRPVLYEDRPNGSIAVETFLPGDRLSRLLQQHSQPDPWRRWQEVGQLAINGLMAYGRCETRREIQIGPEWWNRRLIEPLTPHYDHLVTISSGWPRVWDALKEASLWSFSGGTVPQHGDFTPANLVLKEGRIGVFDWSPEGVEDPPLLDLFQFLASAALFLGQCVEQKTTLTELTECLMTKPRFLEPVARSVAAYRGWCGFGREALTPLSLASLASKVLNLLQRPFPVSDSLRGWVWIASQWAKSGSAESLNSFAGDEDFA